MWLTKHCYNNANHPITEILKFLTEGKNLTGGHGKIAGTIVAFMG